MTCVLSPRVLALIAGWVGPASHTVKFQVSGPLAVREPTDG